MSRKNACSATLKCFCDMDCRKLVRLAAVLEDATALVGGGMSGGRCCPIGGWLWMGDVVAVVAVVEVFIVVGIFWM